MTRMHGGRAVADRIAAAWRDDGWTVRIGLAPFEAAYRAASGLYHAAYSVGGLSIERADVPVVSVGNLVIGGAGKTPVAAWLVEALRRLGARPTVLHGGYGDDEPALHRRWHPEVPVRVGRDRVASARAAAAAGATVVVLDDGFQHRRLARDLDLVLVPAEDWSPRPRLLPRGPWREPPRALRRADVVAVTRKSAGGDRARRVRDAVAAVAPDADVMRLALRPRGWRCGIHDRAAGPDGVTGSRDATGGDGDGGTAAVPAGAAVAVAGIARPDPFVVNAREAGADVVDVLTFPDHHAYDGADVDRIRRRAAGRPVVTTEKDAIKLERLETGLELWILEQTVVAEEGGGILRRRLEALVG